MKLYAENGLLALYANSSTGEFAVLHKPTNHLWYSNPLDKADNNLSGFPKFSMFSQILVESLTDGAPLSQAVSHTGSVVQSGLTLDEIPQGIRLTYKFPMEKITVPIEVALNEDSLSIRLRLNEFSSDNNDKYLMYASLAPYFGSGGVNDEGFIFVPDGSGAIIDFNSRKENYQPYSERVYGRDPAFLGDTRPAIKPPVRLPVFGIKNNDAAFIAVITQGGESATINAYSPGQYNTQNNAYASFQCYAVDSITIGVSSDGNMQTTTKYHFADPLLDVCEVTYYFLTDPEDGYNAMAARYKALLLDGMPGKSVSHYTKPPFYLSLFGAMTKKESVLGFQFNVKKPMTTFAQAVSILENLSASGVNDIVLNYVNWSSAAINYKMPVKYDPAFTLGGKSALSRLLKYGEDKGVDIFLSYDPLSVRNSGNGFTPFFDAAKRVGETNLVKPAYYLSVLLITDTIKPFIYPSLEKLTGYAQKFFNSVAKQSAGVYFPNLGKQLYGNYAKKNFINRQAAKSRLTAEIFTPERTYAVNDANDYALLNAKYILEAPVVSSRQNIVDHDVPFYELAVGGIAQYSLPAVNESMNGMQENVLKAIETGAGLYFNWVYADPSVFINSDYVSMYGTGYQRWFADAVTMWQEVSAAFDQLGSCVPVYHEQLSEGVFRTVYENGSAAIVNYTDTTYNYNGNPVAACGWLAVKGAG
jgi:hypothetical protein